MAHARESLERRFVVGEEVEAVQFGVQMTEDKQIVPKEKVNVTLSYEDAKPYLETWSLDGRMNDEDGMGEWICPTYVWTNYHVFHVARSEVSGNYWRSIPRHPTSSFGVGFH